MKSLLKKSLWLMGFFALTFCLQINDITAQVVVVHHKPHHHRHLLRRHRPLVVTPAPMVVNPAPMVVVRPLPLPRLRPCRHHHRRF